MRENTAKGCQNNALIGKKRGLHYLVSLCKIQEVNQLVPEVLRTADAVYVTGTNLVNSQVSVIVGMATKAKVITTTHSDNLVEKGVLLGVCANFYSVGQIAGEKAVKILKRGKPSSIPIESVKKIRCDSGHEDSLKRPVSDSAPSYEDGSKDNKVN